MGPRWPLALLFQTNFRPIFRNSGLADFYLYSFADNRCSRWREDARTARLSDGTGAGIERGGDLYVYDLVSRAEKRLTTGGSDSIFNGAFDWVYEEEFGMAQAWRWSPDSRHIAYWQTDERQVPIVQLTDYQGKWPSWMKVAYPKVGDPNPKVRIGAVDVASGQTAWLETQNGADEEYIPRIYWTSDPNLLAVLTLNRRQTDARVYLYRCARRPPAGAARAVEDPTLTSSTSSRASRTSSSSRPARASSSGSRIATVTCTSTGTTTRASCSTR
jgi:dipeptidyl-peptidase-4